MSAKVSPVIIDVSAATTLRTAKGDFQLRVFRVGAPHGDSVCIPVMYIDPSPGTLVRINSACLTSEAFGDESCDCRWQLDESIRLIAQERSGLVLYMPHQEGRGLGIFEKVQSMNLMQAKQISTAKAFAELGFQSDIREYSAVAPILSWFNLPSIRIITNNPDKISAVLSESIDIVGRVSLISDQVGLREYLHGKAAELGHLIELDS